MGLTNVKKLLTIFGIPVIFVLIAVLTMSSDWKNTIIDHRKPHGTTWISRKKDLSPSWPDLELLLPLKFKDIHTFRNAFSRSFSFFWPEQNQRITIVMDSEKLNNKHEEAKIKDLKNSKTHIAYNVPSRYYRKGWDRQQLVQFWADNFTDAEYVGFVDADTLFVTPVDYEDLFEDNKPVIIGGMYKELHDDEPYWLHVPKRVSDFLGLTSFFRCNTYFPVIIEVEHLRELRRYVEEYTNTSFNEAFETLNNGEPYSQFGIMCTFLWHKRREKYSWHFQQTHGYENVWQFVPDRSPGARPAWALGVSLPMLLPKPRVAVHTSYMKHNVAEENLYRYLLRAGYCLDERLRGGDLARCSGFNPYQIQKQFFCFENHDWTYHLNASDVFINRQQRRRERRHEWDSGLVRYLTELTQSDLPTGFDVCN